MKWKGPWARKKAVTPYLSGVQSFYYRFIFIFARWRYSIKLFVFENRSEISIMSSRQTQKIDMICIKAIFI
ncbi:hypothetical protein LACBS_01306 [Latilactobacillus sakei subsp. sakei DSM 20017 = JCM 1157]|nr:hypothetical protein LACBS_01306 [Latilactobacillus sakei subsp. sakei DSM 20017 = JCM 1157]